MVDSEPSSHQATCRLHSWSSNCTQSGHPHSHTIQQQCVSTDRCGGLAQQVTGHQRTHHEPVELLVLLLRPLIIPRPLVFCRRRFRGVYMPVSRESTWMRTRLGLAPLRGVRHQPEAVTEQLS